MGLLDFVRNVTVLAHIVGMLLFLNTGMFQPKISLQGRSILLVTAHPDDEAMFFGPTVGYARNQDVPMHLLCLSDGNDKGLGAKRRHELINAAMILGMNPYNVTIVNSPELPDSMTVEWETEVIKNYLEAAIAKFEPTTIVTFDNEGVSNHTNHIQISKAVVEWAQSHPESAPEVWLLNSVPRWRKFIANLDLLYKKLLNPSRLILLSTPQFHFRTWASMFKGHKSQMKWFRYGWLFFSRYMFMNDYKVLRVSTSGTDGAVEAAVSAASSIASAASTALLGDQHQEL